MSAHTPGPWKIYENCAGEPQMVDYLCEDGSYEIYAATLDVKHWVAHALNIDDARLIAYAPDLLEALEALVGENGDLHSAEAHDKAYAALKKAKGIMRHTK